MIPLVAQNTIFNTAPFWATLLGWCFLREGVSKFEIFAMIMSFIGVCLIATSKQITGDVDEEQAKDVEEDEAGGIDSLGKVLLGSGLVFVTSWAFAIVSTLTR